ncbi:hypothetical protein IMSAGC009_04068 [Lachnospiraceae bacterium]|nr:hypothetical protein IMSAGC009_04068 [Lachnospiraceae bacterium]
MENLDREEILEVIPDSEAARDPVIERPYTLRRLKDGDLFPLLKILKKIGIRDCKEAFIQVASGEKSVKEIGVMASFDITDILIGNLAKAEDEIYELWSDLSGIPAGEMKDMEFGTLPLMIMDTFSEARNTVFFRVLSRFLS